MFAMSFDIPEMHTPIYSFRRSTAGTPEARYETLHRAANDVLSDHIKRVKYLNGPAAIPLGGNALPGGTVTITPGGGGALPLPPTQLSPVPPRGDYAGEHRSSYTSARSGGRWTGWSTTSGTPNSVPADTCVSYAFATGCLLRIRGHAYALARTYARDGDATSTVFAATPTSST